MEMRMEPTVGGVASSMLFSTKEVRILAAFPPASRSAQPTDGSTLRRTNLCDNNMRTKSRMINLDDTDVEKTVSMSLTSCSVNIPPGFLVVFKGISDW